MKQIEIDINCDVGEGIGNEQDLLPLISSCNIACGGHAGDIGTMQEVVRLAKQYHVKVGAHPSYPDRKNFGRVSMDISEKRLMESIDKQLSSLISVTVKQGVQLHHIKPHGALYNDIATDTELASVFLKAIESYKSNTSLYVPYKSVIATMALDQGFQIKREAFGDRNYNTDLTLVSRSLPNALIEAPKAVFAHLLSMVQNQQVKTVTGNMVHIMAETYCIHGDTPSALKILTYLSETLPEHTIYIKK
ncbi:MAG: 5-oxoprolinase subunit PxpA [Saonia sp.]